MTMLPRLQAEERLAAIDTAMLAAGAYQPHDARELLDRLRGAAQGNHAQGARTKAVKPKQGELGAIGIGVRMVPASDTSHG
jgi:hypothetical protein